MDLDRRDARRRTVWMAALLPAAVMGLTFSWASAGHVHPAKGLGMDGDRVRRELGTHVLRTLDGRELSLGALRGEVVVVNFWASWCSPCRKELPRLDALHASISGKGGRVLAVSIDYESRNVRRFVKTLGLTLPVYHDGPDGLARKLDLPHVPFTLVLDRSGAVAFTTAGADDGALEAIASATRRLMAAQAVETPSIAGETP